MVILTETAHLLEHDEGSIGKRHPMLPSTFHPRSRNRPELRPEIDFVPSCAEYLPGPGGRQNSEFQSPCGRGRTLPQRADEGANLRIREGSVTLHGAHL